MKWLSAWWSRTTAIFGALGQGLRDGVRGFRRALAATPAESSSQPKSHPGVAYDRKTTIEPPASKTSPHILSWVAYSKALADLEREGHGESPAAVQIRERLSTHWSLMTPHERGEAKFRLGSGKIDTDPFYAMVSKMIEDMKRGMMR